MLSLSRAIRSPLRPALVALSVCVPTGCALLLQSSFPPPGALLPSSGLAAPVEIFLDGLGVPHIQASSDDDAAFAVGFMHGRDRTFQLELIRLASQGRLTELLGKSMLQTDRRMRFLTLDAEKVVELLPPVERQRLEAYCRGINQALEQTPEPVEFKLLGHIPQPWTLRDVVVVGRLQAWDLSGDATLEGTRDLLATTVPAETLSWLNTPARHYGTPSMEQEAGRPLRPVLPEVSAPAPGKPLKNVLGRSAAVSAKASGASSPLQGTQDPAGFRPGTGASAAAVPETSRAEFKEGLAASVLAWLDLPRDGSNGWAVSGKRSSTGKPMLAGDPHLGLPWPSIFYEVHVHTPEVDVSGATFPGMPMVVIGRAEHVAWTLTVSFVDTQDLFRISVDPNNPSAYLLDGASEPFRSWPQVFRWGDDLKESVSEEFKVTRFGPLYNPGREDRLRPDVLYALSWPGFSSDALSMTASFDRLYRASEAQEVRAAVEMLPVPSQNWVFAMDSGQIGWVLGGLLPDRRASPLPRNGATAASAWSGYMENAQRPVLMDPASGFVVASNQPAVLDVGRFHTYTSGGYRALRTATLLESKDVFSAQDMRGFQLDITNLEAARSIQVLRAAWDSQPPAALPQDRSERIRSMAERLFRWNSAMQADGAEALIYETWRRHVYQLLFGRHIADAGLLKRFLAERLAEAPMDVALFFPEGRMWWDDPKTPEVETKDATLVDALVATEAMLVKEFGPSLDGWHWGNVHTLTPGHPFAQKKLLKPLFGTPTLRLPGGRHTLIALTHPGVMGDFHIESGSALRQVVQFDGEMGFVLPGGNSGQPGHPHALDQLDDWRQGYQHAVVAGIEHWKTHATSVIRLVPMGSNAP